MIVAPQEAARLMPTDDHPVCGAVRAAAFFARAARGLAHDPHVVGSAIAAYRERRGQTEAELAAWLGLAGVTTLHKLSLCRRPDPTSPSFDDDVAALAQYFGGDEARLRLLLRTPADEER